MESGSDWLRGVARLEAKLAGDEQSRPWPPGWEQQAVDVPARLGIAAAPLADGRGYRRGGQGHEMDTALPSVLEHRAAEPFPAASTMKVYVLQALFEAADQGLLELDERLVLAPADAVTGSGVLKLLTPGTALSLLDLATLMITVSDNTATNMLIDHVGLERIVACVAKHGWADTRLHGKLQQAPVVGGSKHSPTLTSPRDLADYFSRLWLGELLPDELTQTAKRIYRRQQFTELGRSLDYDSYSAEIGESPLIIASKSGSIRGVRNDAGVFEVAAGPPGEGSSATHDYVVVVMSDGCPDRRFHADNLGAKVVGEAAALTLATLGGGGDR